MDEKHHRLDWASINKAAEVTLHRKTVKRRLIMMHSTLAMRKTGGRHSWHSIPQTLS